MAYELVHIKKDLLFMINGEFGSQVMLACTWRMVIQERHWLQRIT